MLKLDILKNEYAMTTTNTIKQEDEEMAKYVVFKTNYGEIGKREYLETVTAKSIKQARSEAFMKYRNDVLSMKYQIGVRTEKAWNAGY